MSHLEESLLNRWLGQRIIKVSLAVGAAGILPLLLYAVFGPKDGNPIGLGLLMVATTPLAGLGLLVGTIKLLVQRSAREE